MTSALVRYDSGDKSDDSCASSVEFTHTVSNSSGDGGASSAPATDGGTAKSKQAARDSSQASLEGASSETRNISWACSWPRSVPRPKRPRMLVSNAQKAAATRSADTQQAAADPKAPERPSGIDKSAK